MNIIRDLQQKIKNNLTKNRVVMIFGSRRVGKTILMRHIVEQFEGKTLVLNGEDYDTLMWLVQGT